MASESDVEEERRLFYVAMTRAKKAVAFSFAQTRTRNGKHESNSPSRFVREVDSRFVANPLSSSFGDMEDVEPRKSFDGWKRPASKSSGYTYGQSSRPYVERRPQPQAQPQPVRRPQTIPKRVADVDFEPTPILQLRAGQRIEHNRFGYGKIVEISGNVTDRKAKILFDEHGEKILILKYAKIRSVDVAE